MKENWAKLNKKTSHNVFIKERKMDSKRPILKETLTHEYFCFY